MQYVILDSILKEKKSIMKDIIGTKWEYDS